MSWARDLNSRKALSRVAVSSQEAEPTIRVRRLMRSADRVLLVAIVCVGYSLGGVKRRNQV